ncbi:MAG: ABC transporter ATP-binding protein [Acidimicrobiales bacterium]
MTTLSASALTAGGESLPERPVLTVDGLGVSFRRGDRWVPVVRDVHLTVAPGETLGLVGESGCGKSVTGLSIMRLLSPANSRLTGRVLLGDIDLGALPEKELGDVRGDRVAMVFQDPLTSLDPAFKVGDQIAEVVRRRTGASRRVARDRAVEMLDLVGIPNARQRAGEYPHVFSGGMRQRVMIALALVCSPRLLIADEPTTALDVTTQAQILELLVTLQERLGMAILFITHDLGVVADICDRVAVMYAGDVVAQGSAEDIFYRPSHPYTEGLLACSPREHGQEPLVPIVGSVPVPEDYPAGCRFHPRCAYRVEGPCTTSAVPLEPVGPGHAVRCARWSELTLRGVDR